VILDVETTNIPLTEGRALFFTTAIIGFNNMQLPVGVYLNPNPIVVRSYEDKNTNKISSPFTVLNKIMHNGAGLAQKSNNYYAIPLYGASINTLTSRLYYGPDAVIPAITVKSSPVHFKFIIGVQDNVSPNSICTALTTLVTPSANDPYFSGLVLYLYNNKIII